MMTPIALFYLCLGLILVMLALSIWLTPSRASGGESISRGTRLFLVALRLAIGWHFLTEGVDKLNNPAWSSENYLRAASGPLAEHFRATADEPLLARLTVGPGGEFPRALDDDWRRYLDEFVKEFEPVKDQLPTEQQIRDRHARSEQSLKKKLANTKNARDKAKIEKQLAAEDKKFQQALESVQDLRRQAEQALDEARAETLQWLTSKQKFDKLSPYLTRTGEMTVAERIAYYHELQDHMVRVVAEEATPYGAAAEAKVKQARDEADYVIKGLKSDLAAQTEGMRKKLKAILPGDAARATLPPLPPPPVAEWTRLQWADHIVPWALTIVGGLLILGFLTRPACLLAALWMLLLYLTMMPLPGWPEPARTEGHYLFVNKNLIEMLALLALASVRSGRWFGLDSLFALLLAPRRRVVVASRNLARPVPAVAPAPPVSAH